MGVQNIRVYRVRLPYPLVWGRQYHKRTSQKHITKWRMRGTTTNRLLEVKQVAQH
jgi:hypothetical protein